MPRPDRLPKSAEKIIDASLRLSCGQKRLWRADLWLDSGPEGSWIKAEHMGPRLGMTAETVVQYWQRLHRLGLYVPAKGGLTVGRFPIMPVTLGVIPFKLDPKTSLFMARRLDNYLDALKAHEEQRTPTNNGSSKNEHPFAEKRTPVRDGATPVAQAPSMDEGGKGGISPSVVKGVSPSPSEDSQSEGEVATQRDTEGEARAIALRIAAEPDPTMRKLMEHHEQRRLERETKKP